MKISLTDFVDFVVASGTSKLTKVRQIKNRPQYQPQFDHWKDLREAIVVYHAENKGDKKYFDSFIETVLDKKKKESYRPLITNYKSFLGKKKCDTHDTENATWKYKTLEVRINPELCISVNGSKRLMKLYFKSVPLSKQKVDVIFVLMKHSLPKPQGLAEYALLDVNHNKEYVSKDPNDALLPLLYGEADSFITIWNSLPAPAE
jgi:hypothetical protein